MLDIYLRQIQNDDSIIGMEYPNGIISRFIHKTLENKLSNELLGITPDIFAISYYWRTINKG